MKKEIIITALLCEKTFIESLKNLLETSGLLYKLFICKDLKDVVLDSDVFIYNVGASNVFGEYENFLIKASPKTKTIVIGNKNKTTNKFALNCNAYIFLSNPINYDLLILHLKNISLQKELDYYTDNTTVKNIDNYKYLQKNLETLYFSLSQKISDKFVNRIDIDSLSKLVLEFISDIFGINYSSVIVNTPDYQAVRFFGILQNRIPLSVRKNINELSTNLLEKSERELLRFLKNRDFLKTDNYLTKEPIHIVNIPLSSIYVHKKMNVYGYLSLYIIDNDFLIYKDLIMIFINSISYYFNNALYLNSTIDKKQKDNITNLFNHAATIAALGNEIEKIKRYGGTLGVAMVAIDNVNELRRKYNMREQDNIFIKISSIITIELRKSDFVGMIRGNTYLLLLFNNAGLITRGKLEKVIKRIKISLDNITILGIDDLSINTIIAGTVYGELTERLNVVDVIQKLENNMFDARSNGNLYISEE